MIECKSIVTPMEINFTKLCGDVVGPDLENPSQYGQLIGALMFLVNTHPDICYVVNTLSQFMIEPYHTLWITTKHISRYLHGSMMQEHPAQKNHYILVSIGSCVSRDLIP